MAQGRTIKIVVIGGIKMGYQVPAGISNKHIHLSRKDMDVLFGEGSELTKKGDLKQPGQFAAEEQVVIEGPKGSAKLRVLGPFRKETQVELAMTDCRTLGVSAPIRQSGDLEGTPGIKLVGPAGELELKQGVIVAKRHIHIGVKQSEEWNLKTGDVVAVRVDTEDRSLIFGDTEIRVQGDQEDLALMHIDTDEANAAGMKPMNGYIVEF